MKHEIFEIIQNTVYEVTGNKNMIPLIFREWKQFPHAKSGKRDTKTMKIATDNFIYVDLKTNILTKKI